MIVIRNVVAMKEWRHRSLNEDKTVAFFYTKGSIHEAHMRISTRLQKFLASDLIVRQAKMECERIVVVIFVNRLEFGSDEDYTGFPRNEAKDIEKLRSLGYVDALFLPSEEEFYYHGTMSGAVISYHGGMAEVYEIARRPSKFTGMCTMIMKLVGIVQPTHIFVGRNCIQTEMLLRLVMEDLLLPVKVVAAPIYRAPNGVVYDARTDQLDDEGVELAEKVFPALTALVRRYLEGEVDTKLLLNQLRFDLEQPELIIDYVDVVEETTFAPIQKLDHTKGGLLIIGVTIGDWYPMMDNIILAPCEPQRQPFFKRLFNKKKKATKHV